MLRRTSIVYWLGFWSFLEVGLAGGLSAQSAGVIRTADLAGLGVVFELPHGAECLSGVGDVDGDGVDDIALGMWGVLVLYYGQRNAGARVDLRDLATFGEVEGGLAFRYADQFPTQTLQRAGDLDGDGSAELFFGYPLDRIDGVRRGRAFLVRGGLRREGVVSVEEIGSSVPGTIFHSSNPRHDDVGWVTTAVGDVNGDGEIDLAISAPYSVVDGVDGPRAGAGVVFLLFRGGDLPASMDLATVGNEVAGTVLLGADDIGFGHLGDWMAPLGDVNGDGLDDFLVTEPGFRPTRALLLLGRRTWPPVLDMREAAETEGIIVLSGRFYFADPESMAGVGDLNGDGLADFLLGKASQGRDNIGNRVFVVPGRRDFPRTINFDSPPPGIAATILPEDQPSRWQNDYFGRRVASAGDLTGDGLADFLVGAPGARSDTGEVYVIFGSPDMAPISLFEGWEGMRIVGELALGRLGWSLAGAGDFNDDGALDILVNSPQFGTQEPPTPRAYVIYGPGAEGYRLRLVDLEPSFGTVRGGTPVTLRGSSFAPGAEVRFAGRPATVTSVSRSEITVVTPPAIRSGFVDVEVRAGTQTSTLPASYEYTPHYPQIDLTDLGAAGLRLPSPVGRGFHGSLAFADLSDDGVDDLLLISNSWVVGAYGWVVSIVRGGPGLSGDLDPLAASPSVGVIRGSGNLAGGLGALGDLNGDGTEDFGFGLTGASSGYVVFGGGLPAESDIEGLVGAGAAVRVARGPFIGNLAFLGTGDVTGDGIDDFAVTFHFTSGEIETRAGELLIVEGRRHWPAELDLSGPDVRSRIRGAFEWQRFAWEAVNVGDVNGDGLSDILATSWAWPGRLPLPYDGLLYLLYGSAELPADLDVEEYLADLGGVVIGIDTGTPRGPGCCYHVGAAGDVNADGHADFVIATEEGGENIEGLSYIVPGGPSLPAELLIPPEPPGDGGDGIARIHGGLRESRTGWAAGPAGDFNGDGYEDVGVTGQLTFFSDPVVPPILSVIFGAEKLPERVNHRRIGSAGLGWSGPNPWGAIAAPATGDLNADGRVDFAFVQERGFDLHVDLEVEDPPEFPGAVYVVFGLTGRTRFLRGNADGEGPVNLTDGIFTLTYLFLGGREPPCKDAADANDSGTIELTDAVYVLNHLFLGGSPPPEPYPLEGEDPTEDRLGCEGL